MPHSPAPSTPTNAPPLAVWRLLGLERRRLTSLDVTLFAVAGLMVLFAGWRTLRDVRTFAGVDFRNRVVGARVMLAGYDPYAFIWQPGMPEEWLDPVRDPKVHRLTVTPPTLWLYAAIAPLPYGAERLVSWAVEWAALLLSVVLLVRTIPRQRQRVAFLLGTVMFLVLSDVWRLHLERGQVYVIQLLLLSAAIYLGVRRGLDSVAMALALGALALMRPNLMLFAPALAVVGRWRAAATMAAVCAVAVTVTMAIMPAGTYRSYLATGDRYYTAVWNPEALPDFTYPPTPDVVEGHSFHAALRNVSSTSFGSLYQIGVGDGWLPVIDVGIVSKAVMIGLGVTLLGLLLLRRRSPAQREALALMVTFAIDTEFFLPHRWGYSDVMLLAPVALLVPAIAAPGRDNRLALGMVLVGLAAGQMGQHFLALEIATALRSWLVMGALTALAVACWFRSPAATVSPGATPARGLPAVPP